MVWFPGVIGFGALQGGEKPEAMLLNAAEKGIRVLMLLELHILNKTQIYRVWFDWPNVSVSELIRLEM